MILTTWLTMSNFKVSIFRRIAFVVLVPVLASGITPRTYHSSVVTDTKYHSFYDDTTLTVENSKILLPYNRYIDPAGSVISFGTPTLENHSLDCVLLPGGKVLAV